MPLKPPALMSDVYPALGCDLQPYLDIFFRRSGARSGPEVDVLWFCSVCIWEKGEFAIMFDNKQLWGQS